MIGVVVLRLVWAGTVLGALALLFHGLLARVYFSLTPEALLEARRGGVLVAVACLLLAAAAGYSALVAEWPRWVAAGLLTPVLLCGGLAWLAPETLLSQLAIVVAYPAALAAGIGGLVLRPPRSTIARA